jgi:hypothetical protein
VIDIRRDHRAPTRHFITHKFRCNHIRDTGAKARSASF